VVSVVADGVAQGALLSFTLNNVSANGHTLKVIFIPDGDLNGDGAVTVVDALKALQISGPALYCERLRTAARRPRTAGRRRGAAARHPDHSGGRAGYPQEGGRAPLGVLIRKREVLGE